MFIDSGSPCGIVARTQVRQPDGLVLWRGPRFFIVSLNRETHARPFMDDMPHPPGFRRRRGLNWAFIGLLYTSFYMCRYNLSLSNRAISAEFGFSKADMGTIITVSLLAYAFGQIINGLLTDRFGGKRAMLIGAAGTIVMNVLFG